MAAFAYNKAKNASNGQTPLELNCGYHPRVSYKKVIDPVSQSKSAEEVAIKLKELLTVCQKNFSHAQDLQNRHHDKNVKLRNHATSDQVW